jgi:Phage integrase, N-terminal SAM-like domain
MGILRDRMVEEMKLRNFSAATQESYLYAVTRLTKHYRRSPDQLDKEQIRSYLLHLTVERKLSPNTMMGQIAGLRVRYPMEELLSAGMLATLHQCAHDGVALRRQSMSALAQPAHDFIHAASHDAALWRMSRHKY